MKRVYVCAPLGGNIEENLKKVKTYTAEVVYFAHVYGEFSCKFAYISHKSRSYHCTDINWKCHSRFVEQH